VTNLVDGLVLLARQVSVPVHGIFFEKVADFVARRKEVVVADVVVVPSGKFGLLGELG
jgi:hypothetical protein